jgi:hypothetical protein
MSEEREDERVAQRLDSNRRRDGLADGKVEMLVRGGDAGELGGEIECREARAGGRALETEHGERLSEFGRLARGGIGFDFANEADWSQRTVSRPPTRPSQGRSQSAGGICRRKRRMTDGSRPHWSGHQRPNSPAAARRM